MLEVALVTCRSLPDLDPDDRLLLEPLASLGCRVAAAAWDDRQVDWERFDVSVIRSTWDYTGARDAFVAWARSVPRLLNPPSVVAWNTDKEAGRAPQRGEPGLSRRLVLLTVYAEERGLRAQRLDAS